MAVIGKQMPVELGICFGDQTWGRAIVSIPQATPKNQIKTKATRAYLDQDKDVVVEHTWVQSFGDELRAELNAE